MEADERSGDGAHDALRAAAPAPLFDELDEARPFERPDVVVDLLTRQAQLVGFDLPVADRRLLQWL